MTLAIYSISGVDGSGKSTQAERVIARLRSEGATVEYFHAIQFSIAQRLRGGRPGAPGERDAVTHASRVGILARRLFLRVDLLRFAGYRRRLERSGVDALVTDRYFYDTVVNIAYLSKRPIARVRIPRPACAVFLYVGPELIMTRERAPEQGLAYLQDKTALYRVAVARFGLVEVDGAASEDVVEGRIRDALGR